MAGYEVFLNVRGKGLPAPYATTFAEIDMDAPLMDSDSVAFPSMFSAKSALSQLGAGRDRHGGYFNFSRVYAGEPGTSTFQATAGFSLIFGSRIHDDYYNTDFFLFEVWLAQFASDGLMGTSIGPNGQATLIYALEGRRFTAGFEPMNRGNGTGGARKILDLGTPRIFGPAYWPEVEASLRRDN